MSWSFNHCENPDFFVRSVPDDVDFPVQRAAMQNSEVFRDMFSCCEAGPAASEDAVTNEPVLDLHESAGAVAALLRLLHDPPPHPVPLPVNAEQEKYMTHLPKAIYDPSTVIPLPLLTSLLFRLVDKYALPDSISESLSDHLLAHAPVHPLQVYGFASQHDMDKVASKASQYLMPLASYTLEDIRVIPSVDAYHKIVVLQDIRVKALRDLLLKEDIFPHGYGECPTHRDHTKLSWDRQRKALALKIETDTDVAGEMEVLADELQGCKLCHKACTAAVEMLAYKCRKVPRAIHQLAQDNWRWGAKPSPVSS